MFVRQSDEDNSTMILNDQESSRSSSVVAKMDIKSNLHMEGPATVGTGDGPGWFWVQSSTVYVHYYLLFSSLLGRLN